MSSKIYKYSEVTLKEKNIITKNQKRKETKTE